MFSKKKLTDSDIEQMKIDLSSSMNQADESRKRFLAERVKKLRAHSQKVETIRRRSLSEHSTTLTREIPQSLIEFIQNIKSIKTLEEFQSFMLLKETIGMAQNMVQFIEESQDKASLLCDEIKNRPKIFLSMMLLARFANEMMPETTAEEQKLLKESAEIFNLLNSDELKEDCKAIAWKWSKAVLYFAEWSSKDRFTLRINMRQDFLRWQKKIGNWQKEHHSHAEWEPHVLEYQIQIVNKIYQVFGHAEIESLKKDVQQLNNTFTEADLVIEFDNEIREYKCYWKDRIKSGFDANKENTELLQETRKKIKNIEILHELMLKEDSVNFEKVLNMAGSGTLDEITKNNIQTIKKLTIMLKDVQDDHRIIGVLVDIYEYMKGSLIELAGENSDYRQEIELIDCSLSKSDWVKDSEAFLRSVLIYCKKCCAPVRDSHCARIEELIEKLSQPPSTDELSLILMQTISEFLELLNKMRADYSNFRLKMLAIQLEGKGVAEKYELEYLQEATAGKFSNTEQWLKCTKHEAGLPLDILVKAFLQLFDPQEPELKDETLPETFSLDAERIRRYRKALHQELLSKTIGLVMKNHLKLSSSAVEELQEQVKKSLDAEEISKLIDTTIGEAEQGKVLKSSVKRLLQNSADDKVFTLLKNREFAQIRTKMLSKENNQLGTSIQDKIVSLFRYNKACFSEIYDKILQK